MGGDECPGVPIRGVLMTLRDLPPDFTIQLVGKEEIITEELHRARIALQYRGYDKSRIKIINATEVIGMGDRPAEAIRRYPDSSIHVGIRLQKEKKSNVFVSAGNTGAVMSAAVTILGRIKGIRRPALVGVFPTLNGFCVVVDIGACVDGTPEILAQSGITGSLYARFVLGKNNPRVGLMNVGEERDKGNELVRQTYPKLVQLAKDGKINFVGNIEGGDVLTGEKTDVIIVDGFTGNVILKFAGNIYPILKKWLKKIVKESPPIHKVLAGIAMVLQKPLVKILVKELDREKYGGVPLIGADGVVVICHGKSSPRAIVNAIDQGRKTVIEDINGKIKENLAV